MGGVWNDIKRGAKLLAAGNAHQPDKSEDTADRTELLSATSQELCNRVHEKDMEDGKLPREEGETVKLQIKKQ